MKIDSIQITRHRLPLEPPVELVWQSGQIRHFEITVVRVTSDHGHVGIGSGSSMLGFKGFEDLFVGADPMDFGRHWRTLDNLSFHYGRCWALDIALWDLAGKISGKPVYQLLGGDNSRIKTYAAPISPRNLEETLSHAEACEATGFSAIRVNFSQPRLEDDLNVLEKVRETVGAGTQIVVGCHQAWRAVWDTNDPWRLDQAIHVASQIAGDDLLWIEEPLHRGNHDGLATLRRVGGVPVAAGSGVRENHELRHLIGGGCVDVLRADATSSGGITGLASVYRAALDAGVRVSPNTFGCGIGLLANAHLVAGCGGISHFEFPFEPPQWSVGRRDFMLSEAVMVDSQGILDLGHRPGLGFELDEEALEATIIA